MAGTPAMVRVTRPEGLRLLHANGQLVKYKRGDHALCRPRLVRELIGNGSARYAAIHGYPAVVDVDAR